MDKTKTTEEITINTEELKTKDESSKAHRGKMSSKRREEKRAPVRAKNEAEKITNDALKRLGLNTTEFDNMKPSTTKYASGVHVNLLSANSAVNEMLNQLPSVAPRALAILLQDPVNTNAYRKVAAYAITARVAQCQINAPFVTGNNLEMEHAFKSEDYQLLSNYLCKIPEFMAWILSNIGHFTQDGQQIIPLLPHTYNYRNITIDMAMSGNYLAVSQYVLRHVEGVGGIIIPAAERDRVRQLCNVFPISTNAGTTRFTAASALLFRQNLTIMELQAFEKVNRAINELNCMCAFDFNDSKGTTIPTVRFPRLEVNNLINTTYYSQVNQTPNSIRAALILKLGLDEHLNDIQREHRFIAHPDIALIRGSDCPEPLLQAQLFLCRRKRENAPSVK